MAPKQEVFHLHPLGWENDPEEEKFPLSTLDYLSVMTYNSYAIFFKNDNGNKSQVIETLKAGLERTLSQLRHLCGSIEKDPRGSHAFVKKKDSTVQFIVQHLDTSDDADNYPSYNDIERANFCTLSLGDLTTWTVAPMTYGMKPESHIDNSPLAAGFKVNFIRGGIILVMNHHHYSNDVMGWAGYTRQLAENCFAYLNKTPYPDWDPKCLDLSRITKAEPAEGGKVEGPPKLDRHPGHSVASSLLFHLPKSKGAELKRLASPDDGSWVSTYDAFSAFIWRTVTRLRTPVFGIKPGDNLIWIEAVDMRRRFRNPEVPARLRGNVMSAAATHMTPFPQPTAADIISEWPLPKLASYIRQLTNSVTEESLDQLLTVAASVRDKSSLNLRPDALPPGSIVQTDHRDATVAHTNFGFGSPITYRHITDMPSEGVFIVYPPRSGGPDSDEGPEITMCYENSLAQELIDDAEWNKFFEYRGVDTRAKPRT